MSVANRLQHNDILELIGNRNHCAMLVHDDFTDWALHRHAANGSAVYRKIRPPLCMRQHNYILFAIICLSSNVCAYSHTRRSCRRTNARPGTELLGTALASAAPTLGRVGPAAAHRRDWRAAASPHRCMVARIGRAEPCADGTCHAVAHADRIVVGAVRSVDARVVGGDGLR